MRILPPFEEKIRHSIRDELARNPTITMVGLKERIDQEYGRSFHHTYIRKLVGKVRGEITHEIDTAKIEPRLAVSRENYRLVRERLAQIVFWQSDPENPSERKPTNKDVIEAAKNMVMMDLALLHAEMAAGIYKKPINEIVKTFQYEPVPGEVRAVIMASWQRGGLLPRQAIEEMVPALPTHAATDGATA
jgi:hypothetical protein